MGPPKQLLFSITKKDLEVKAVRGSGPGGQHRNKVSTGIQITHRPSGAQVTATSEKSQLTNKKNAIRLLTQHPKFKAWLNEQVYISLNKESLEETVDKMLEPSNLRVEVRNVQGKWVRV